MNQTTCVNSLRWLAETGDSFLAGVRSKLDKNGPWIFGGRVEPPVNVDQSLRFKNMLVNASLFDRELLLRTPANTTCKCDVTCGWLLRSRRARVVAVNAVDLDEVIRQWSSDRPAEPSQWPPLSEPALEAALRDYRDPPRRTFIGVCSASGFSQGAMELARRRASSLAARGGGLVLVEPREDGGWKLHSFDASGGGPGSAWLFVFDPEAFDDKIERVRSAILDSSIDLCESGLSAGRLAEQLNVPPELVRQVFQAEVDRTPGLRIRQLDGETTLLAAQDFAPTPAQERTVSMFQKLRDLLGLRGNEDRKIELLADKRALLTGRRDRLYRELDELGEREQSLKARGVAADSEVTRRRIASELGQVRRRIEQGNSMVSLLNRQVDILSTHMHHLTLLSQGQDVQMPDVEEMTRDAVRAEELIERVRSDAEMVETLSEATGATLTSKLEQDIMAEFAAARQQQAAEAAPAEPPARAGEASASREPAQGDVPPQRGREKPLRE